MDDALIIGTAIVVGLIAGTLAGRRAKASQGRGRWAFPALAVYLAVILAVLAVAFIRLG